MVMVKVVVVIRLVVRIVHAPAQLGADGKVDVLVLHVDHGMGHFASVLRQPVVKRIRVNAALHALMASPLIKTRHHIGGVLPVRRNGVLFFLQFHFAFRLRAQGQGANQRQTH